MAASFRIEVRTSFPEWERYNVYMTAVCFAADGSMADYVNLTDKSDVLQTLPCDHADVYLYIIAREFPASDIIAKSPPFDIDLVVTPVGQGKGEAASRKAVSRKAVSKPSVTTYAVNQWGGLSVKQTVGPAI